MGRAGVDTYPLRVGSVSGTARLVRSTEESTTGTLL
jgi:hypothetical protein